MIGKCKAIAHGSTALEYIFREGKFGQNLVSNNLCGTTPKEIYEEMRMVNDYNSRCRNKFLRIEIGIAPKDESRLSFTSVRNLASNFARRMGLDDHQWVAVTHKDTDNMHIHIIANRISLYGSVYDTTFVSNRAARVAEELSRKYGLTIAKEIKAERKYQKAKANPARETAKQQVQKICHAAFEKYREMGRLGHSLFLYELHRSSIGIERMKNKQGKIYGLKFSYGGHTFKASEIGRKFGYHSLQKNFDTDDLTEGKQQASSPPQEMEKKRPLDTDRPLVFLSHSSCTPSSANDKLQVPQTTGSTVETAMSIAGEVLAGLGGIVTPQVHGDDYAEMAWQRRLRNQVNKKKKRGRGL
ncbi:relaxase/mobilization nuclease domain-containing protein [Prevotella sp. HUN102]|uniref:relaxase/mobilization nuclease domain-containing protein n=1 Tax=Prevotella sp. HUN102 TaxID=1392486 RepID=UPI00048A7824|nr:relaxase/mobilization nuclease domain-containing protein [Prevotella sp. HUN102]